MSTHSPRRTSPSTIRTMQLLVDNTIAPYFEEEKKKLGLPVCQKSIFYIDSWSVHRSAEFRTWMKKNHTNIIILYVPAGCTGDLQPNDTLINRIFKHAMTRAYHKGLVDDLFDQLCNLSDNETVDLQRNLAHLRNKAVAWIWDGYETCNNAKIVKKVSIRHLTSHKKAHLLHRHGHSVALAISTSLTNASPAFMLANS